MPRSAAVYPPELQLFAARERGWLAGAERALAEVLGDAGRRQRWDLDPMPRPQRKALHQLAAQYGLTTTSQGAEPSRHVVVWKARPSIVGAGLGAGLGSGIPHS